MASGLRQQFSIFFERPSRQQEAPGYEDLPCDNYATFGAGVFSGIGGGGRDGRLTKAHCVEAPSKRGYGGGRSWRHMVIASRLGASPAPAQDRGPR